MAANFSASMTMISMSVMLPPIMAAFDLPTSTVQWLTSGASLVSGVMIPVAAYLIKRLPNKLFFFIAMLMFSLGSLLCLVAESFSVLLTGRLIQAVGGGLIMPFSQIIIISIYPKERHGTAMGYFTLGMLIAPVISPYIAGSVIDNLGWQFMFNIFLMISLATKLMGLLFMKNITAAYREHFSASSAALSSLAFFGILFGVGNLALGGILRADTGGAILAGLFMLALFIKKQLGMALPLLDLRLFRYRAFRIPLLIAITMYFSFMGGGTLLPIYGQTILGLPARTYALVILPGSILMAVVTVISGKLYDRQGPRMVLIWGALLLMLGNTMGILFSLESSLPYVAVASFFPAAGLAILMPPIVPMAISDFNDKERVDGSAILGTVRLVVNGLVVIYSTLLYTHFSGRFNPMAGIRASYISATAFSVILLGIIMTSIPKTSRGS